MKNEYIFTNLKIIILNNLLSVPFIYNIGENTYYYYNDGFLTNLEVFLYKF